MLQPAFARGCDWGVGLRLRVLAVKNTEPSRVRPTRRGCATERPFPDFTTRKIRAHHPQKEPDNSAYTWG